MQTQSETVDDEQPDEPCGWEGASERAAVLEWRTRDDEQVRKYFPDAPAEALYTSARPWPELSGVLCILFMPRSGSTFLSEQLSRRYAVGRILESFNWPALTRAGTTPAEAIHKNVNRLHEGPWFGVKTGRPGLAVAERCGFFDEYIARTSFILLFRRDIVAQAVSMVKARITSRFQFAHAEKRDIAPSDDYDYDRIARHVNIHSHGIQKLIEYAQATGRPVQPIAYEDFDDGDLREAESICDGFGIPRRTGPPPHKERQIEKIGDAVNEEWCSRFQNEMDKRMRRRLDRQFKTFEELKSVQQ